MDGGSKNNERSFENDSNPRRTLGNAHAGNTTGRATPPLEIRVGRATEKSANGTAFVTSILNAGLFCWEVLRKESRAPYPGIRVWHRDMMTRDVSSTDPGFMPTLTLFDLDHTLVALDTNQAWVAFLIELGALDGRRYTRQSRKMQVRYRHAQGGIDWGFCEFFMGTLTALPRDQLERALIRFVDERVRPCIPSSCRELVQAHRERGEALAIITATNRFITEPIAALFGISTLIATEPEVRDGIFTGHISGTPSMREGKIARLDAWLATGALKDALCRSDLSTLRFYSDSINDLPLLELATEPIAVNPDERLASIARARHWPVLYLPLFV